MRAQVVVLGDFGRSPRMQYHAISLSQQALKRKSRGLVTGNAPRPVGVQAGCEVDVVAYEGSRPTEAILADPKIHLHLIAAPRLNEGELVWAVFAVWQLIFVMIFKLPRAQYILLQNPPCIPTFTLCQIACFFRRTRLVIDWHNYGTLPCPTEMLRPGNSLASRNESEMICGDNRIHIASALPGEEASFG
eukprot:3716669-Pyramimonas_sp.AAC.1